MTTPPLSSTDPAIPRDEELRQGIEMMFYAYRDFTAEPDGPEYDAITGPKDPVHGRVRYADRFADAWVAAGNDEADCVTFPADRNYSDLRLDYCFVSTALAGRVRSAQVDRDAAGSDHQPLWVDMDL